MKKTAIVLALFLAGAAWAQMYRVTTKPVIEDTIGNTVETIDLEGSWNTIVIHSLHPSKGVYYHITTASDLGLTVTDATKMTRFLPASSSVVVEFEGAKGLKMITGGANVDVIIERRNVEK